MNLQFFWWHLQLLRRIRFFTVFFGKMTTESYEKMAERLLESNWYRLNLNLQKDFIVIIANMQRPLCYHGFGVITLNLETFGKVSLYKRSLIKIAPI